MLRCALYALILSLCAQRAASAFALTGDKWPQAVLGAPVTITYSYSNALDGGLLDPSNQPVSAVIIRDSIQEALSLWASVAPLNFVEVPDAGPLPTSSNPEYPVLPGYPEIRFGHEYIDGFGNYKAFTYYPYSTSSGLAGDVHFDDADRWSLVGSLTYPDILGCAEHEIGHALGLDHSALPTAIMYPTFQRMNGLGTGYLTADDIAGIQAIYGPGVGSVKPLVPEPSSLALAAAGFVLFAMQRFRTVWRRPHDANSVSF